MTPFETTPPTGRIARILGPAAILCVAALAGRPALAAFSEVAFGGPFTLVDHRGGTVTDADFRGRHLLIFFGYSFCPDVCPTELQTVAEVMDLLGRAAGRVQPLFVTVDPERDRPALLADYVASFHPRLIGLTGTVDQVRAAAQAYRVRYYKVFPPPFRDGDDEAEREGEDGDTAHYLISHSAAVYLVGPDGRGLGAFAYGTPAEEIAARLRGLLD